MFPHLQREGAKACARLNNESDLGGHQSPHPSSVESLSSPSTGLERQTIDVNSARREGSSRRS